MRSAARKTSAASEIPKKCAKTDSRAKPATRERKIPAATITAPAPWRRGDCAASSDGIVHRESDGSGAIGTVSTRRERQTP